MVRQASNLEPLYEISVIPEAGDERNGLSISSKPLAQFQSHGLSARYISGAANDQYWRMRLSCHFSFYRERADRLMVLCARSFEVEVHGLYPKKEKCRPKGF